MKQATVRLPQQSDYCLDRRHNKFGQRWEQTKVPLRLLVSHFNWMYSGFQNYSLQPSRLKGLYRVDSCRSRIYEFRYSNARSPKRLQPNGQVNRGKLCLGMIWLPTPLLPESPSEIL
jgi:hypothetical protein